MILAFQLIGSATDTRESRDGLALCQFKYDNLVSINTQTHIISPNDSGRKYALRVMAW